MLVPVPKLHCDVSFSVNTVRKASPSSLQPLTIHQPSGSCPFHLRPPPPMPAAVGSRDSGFGEIQTFQLCFMVD